jgi:hypothetical protein
MTLREKVARELARYHGDEDGEIWESYLPEADRILAIVEADAKLAAAKAKLEEKEKKG